MIAFLLLSEDVYINELGKLEGSFGLEFLYNLSLGTKSCLGKGKIYNMLRHPTPATLQIMLQLPCDGT